MSVIKLEIRLHEIPRAIEVFRKSRKKALEVFTEEIRTAVSTGFNQLLNTEIDLFLGEDGQAGNKLRIPAKPPTNSGRKPSSSSDSSRA